MKEAHCDKLTFHFQIFRFVYIICYQKKNVTNKNNFKKSSLLLPIFCLSCFNSCKVPPEAIGGAV